MWQKHIDCCRLLPQSQNKSTIEFKICLRKNAYFDPHTIKDKAISGIFLQKITNTSFTRYRKTIDILIILHIALVCMSVLKLYLF